MSTTKMNITANKISPTSLEQTTKRSKTYQSQLRNLFGLGAVLVAPPSGEIYVLQTYLKPKHPVTLQWSGKQVPPFLQGDG